MFDLKKLFLTVQQDIQNSNNLDQLDKIRVEYLGKKGFFSKCMIKIKNLSCKEKKKYGIMINQIKKKIVLQISIKKNQLDDFFLNKRIEDEKIDVSLPGRYRQHGSFHPIQKSIIYIKNFFNELGFQSIDGFEIEDEYHNFDALNIPKHHPSRNTHDTFWFDNNRLLRTQTSSMQIRIMKKNKPPIKCIFPGKVYRNDYDSTHTPMFHQIEGLIVNKSINFSNLKWIIYNFLYYFFNEKTSIRFRPSYFPFTVLSAEVDIMTNSGQWLEILGCGMVHPDVLNTMNIDSNIYSGCAFGIGIERITMLRYGILDIRSFFENDIRFLTQFKNM